MTQVEVGEALGCDQAMVSSWEVGRTRPSSATLKAIAGLFRISMQALESGEGFDSEAASLQPASGVGPHLEGAEDPLELRLEAVPGGRVMLVDARTGRQEPIDPADAIADLLKALKRGRTGWVVIR